MTATTPSATVTNEAGLRKISPYSFGKTSRRRPLISSSLASGNWRVTSLKTCRRQRISQPLRPKMNLSTSAEVRMIFKGVLIFGYFAASAIILRGLVGLHSFERSTPRRQFDLR
jgi:hypothetical protein